VNDGPVEDGLAHGEVVIGSKRVLVLQAVDGFGIDVVVSSHVQERAVVAHDHRALGVAEPEGVHCDGIEDRLRVRGRATDDPEDLGRRGLLLERLRLALQRFRQALPEVVNPGPFVLPRLAGDRKLGFDLSLRGLCSAPHRSLLASHSERSTKG
jgi:hypothetical protein